MKFFSLVAVISALCRSSFCTVFFSVVLSASVVEVSAEEAAALSKDEARKELRTVYAELSAAKKKYNKVVSELRKAKHPDLTEVEKKFMASSAPITKAMEKHPDLAKIRARRDKAAADWSKAVKEKDSEATKKAISERSKAKSDLHKAAYKHQDIIPLIKAREALGKERESVKKKLVAEKDPELVKKMTELEVRKEALRKIISG